MFSWYTSSAMSTRLSFLQKRTISWLGSGSGLGLGLGFGLGLGLGQRLVTGGSARRRGHHAQPVLEVGARQVHERRAEEIGHAAALGEDDGPWGARVP